MPEREQYISNNFLHEFLVKKNVKPYSILILEFLLIVFVGAKGQDV